MCIMQNTHNCIMNYVDTLVLSMLSTGVCIDACSSVEYV